MGTKGGRQFVFSGLFLISAVFLSAGLWAREIVTSPAAEIKITKPDGSIMSVGGDRVLSDVPSGSMVKLLGGTIKVSPARGFIQVVVGDSVVTIEVGDAAVISFIPKTKAVNFQVDKGQVDVIAGNTAATVGAGQEVKIGLDKWTGIVEVESVKGVIETITVGVKARLLEGSVVRLSADSKTREVHVESAKGNVLVTSIDGELTMLAKAGSIDMEGSAEGEVLTFAGVVEEMPIDVLVEEPSEPERPEASPFRP